MNWIVPLADVKFGVEEQEAVRAVLESGWLTMGEVTAHFEAEFKAYTGARHAFAVSNATVGLHMACLALGIGPGDEVIVPSLTFVATANAVRYTGAQPIFADITSENDLTISLDAIKQAVTPHTKALMLMHYAGYACDMPTILQWAQEQGLMVIEDAAHAVGSFLQEKHLGTWGDAGVFSFFSNKNLSTGEGGMVVTDDDALAAQFKLLRSHGMTSLTWDRHQGHAWSYDVVTTGYNYRIDEIRSALGRVQLEKLDGNNARRSALSARYRELLAELCPALRLPFEGHRGISAHHIMPVLLPRGAQRERFMERLKEQGIQTSIHYPPVHTFSAYRQTATGAFNLPITGEVAAREVTLPLYPTMTEDQVQLVALAAARALES
jgi:dTDP-4-amino-4,6-dideoxygalactose transaminase